MDTLPNAAAAPTRRRVLGAGAGIAAASVGLFAADAATAAPQPTAAPRPTAASRPRPTVVLVHGAWADASSWRPVVGRLLDRGVAVAAVPNPLRSLSGDAASIAAILDAIPGPVVLVGHSYGGAVITNAARGRTDVLTLVYVNAFAPDQDETTLGLAAAQPGSALAVADPTTIFYSVPYPGGGGDVDLYLKPEVFVRAFTNDLPRATGTALAVSQRAVTYGAGSAPSGPPAWSEIPSWYLVGTRDLVIPPAQQRIMAARARARTVEVRAGHLSMLSRPDAVTSLIMAAVRASR